jgi:aerobic carbon-monoxide dehydrogenase small subunit
VTAHLPISLEVNGEPVDALVLPRTNLADFLREQLQLTGTHVGCEHGVCGACTLRVNGDIVRSCLMLAVQANNASVETIEGLSDSGEIADLQAAFRDRNALQCGFCTPGMLMAAQDLLRQNPTPDREQIREHLSGNYCRCTGYQAIVDSIESVARSRAGNIDAPASPDEYGGASS